jgi:pyruvate dehydrogenase E1 component alpha subunit
MTLDEQIKCAGREMLIAFEQDIANEFNAGKIRAPIHLYSGNEERMIEIFKDVRPDDWVCCSWRSHYQCLLKGVPPAELKAEIMAGRSISLCFPVHRVISSAIVGGILPIATGIAMGIKRNSGPERVYCFMGEMTYETGIAHECMKYAKNFSLPITWIVEDNGKSVCTPTEEVWGWSEGMTEGDDLRYYKYNLTWPHAGAGKRVQF